MWEGLWSLKAVQYRSKLRLLYCTSYTCMIYVGASLASRLVATMLLCKVDDAGGACLCIFVVLGLDLRASS